MALTITERKFLEDEFIRCSEDISYFAKNYCYIQSTGKGIVKFNLYPFQETVLGILEKNNKIIINKSRQMGLSTVIGLKIIWKMIFEDNFKVAIYANKFATASEIVDKVKLIYNELPVWMKGKEPPVINNNKELRLSNGSKVKAFAASKDSARSQASSMVVLDEAHYIPNASEIMTSVLPTISTGGEIILLSTPSIPSGMFYDYWMGAIEGKNGFVPIELPWSLHPQRDQSFRDQADREMGKKEAHREYDCQFGGASDTVYDQEIIDYIEKNTVEPPQSMSDEMNEFWYWDYPNYSKNYICIIDTARGDGGDDSTIQVIDLDTFEQCAEYQGQLDPHALAMRAKSTAIYYNNALLVVENTGIGEATCLELESIEYDNLYKTNKSSDTPDSNQYINTYAFNDNLKTGFSNNVKTRPLILAKFQECLIDKSITIKSSRTLHELKTFVWLNGKAQASRGSHDDLIMPLAIACYLRETALMFASKSVAMSKQLVSNIAIYKNNEFNQMMNNNYDYNRQIIDRYGLNNYDIWGTNR